MIQLKIYPPPLQTSYTSHTEMYTPVDVPQEGTTHSGTKIKR